MDTAHAFHSRCQNKQLPVRDVEYDGTRRQLPPDASPPLRPTSTVHATYGFTRQSAALVNVFLFSDVAIVTNDGINTFTSICSNKLLCKSMFIIRYQWQINRNKAP